MVRDVLITEIESSQYNDYCGINHYGYLLFEGGLFPRITHCQPGNRRSDGGIDFGADDRPLAPSPRSVVRPMKTSNLPVSCWRENNIIPYKVPHSLQAESFVKSWYCIG